MKLSKLKLSGIGLLVAIGVVWILGPLSTGLSLLAFTSGASSTPALALAYARGDVGACDSNGYWATMRAAFIPAEQISIMRASKKLASEGGLEQWQTPDGVFWKPLTTDLFFVLAEQRVAVYENSGHQVHKGDIVIDSGANVGAFTRRALNEGAKLVVAVEPSPDNVESLRRTFAKEEREGRVIVYPKGVWDKEDTLTLTMFQDSALDSFVMSARSEQAANVTREVNVPLTTIDHLMQELGLPRVDFIKMDIEGAERNALDGARATIQKFRPRMSIATENLKDDYEVVPQVISKLVQGYRVSCGLFRMTGGASARPDVMLFTPGKVF